MPKPELLSRLRTALASTSTHFEKEIKELYDAPDLLPLLCHLLSSDIAVEQQQLAATGIKLAVWLRLERDPKEWCSIWKDIESELLLRDELDKIPWKVLSLVSKAMELLLEQFEGEFCQIMNSLFEKLSFRGKLLMYETFIFVETTSETRFIFLRETVELFIKETFQFLCWAHKNRPPTADTLQLQKAALENLQVLLTNLNKMEGDSYAFKILTGLRLNQDLLSIILEELLFAPSKSDYQSLGEKEFSKERMKELVFMERDEAVNGNKARAVRIFQVVLGSFDKKSQIEEFDTFPQLNLMESMMPLVADLLCKTISKQAMEEETQEVIVALIDWLAFCCKFNFLLQLVEEQFQNLLFLVCYPLLAIDQEELHLYKDNNSLFITITEEMVENMNQRESSPKNSASDLFQNMVDTVNGALTNIVELNVRIGRHLLLGSPESSYDEIREQYDLQISIETVLTALSLMAEQYKNRPELISTIKDGLLDLPEIHHLEGIAEAKLMLFLTYTYEPFYKDRQIEASQFLLRAARHLDQDSILTECALLLYRNCVTMAFQADILNLLFSKVVEGRFTPILEVLGLIVQKQLKELEPDRVKELIQKVISRLIKEFALCKEGGGEAIKGSAALLKCLNLLEQVSDDSEYLLAEPALVNALWPVFDLFEFAKEIEFEDNVMNIFANAMKGSRQITSRHFDFIDIFPSIYIKTEIFNEAFETVFGELIVRGREHFLFEDGLKDIANTLQCLYRIYDCRKSQEALTFLCIYCQYAYSQYGEILDSNCDLVDRLGQIYQERRQSLGDEALAAMINLFLTWEIQFGYPRHWVIENYYITIFRGYQSKVASVNFRKLIEKHYDSPSLIKYLQFAIRLLHFIRAEVTQQKRPKKLYAALQSKALDSIDPFIETCNALNFLKKHLQNQKYDCLLESLKEEISLGEVRDLLTHRIVSRGLRTCVQVRKKQID